MTIETFEQLSMDRLKTLAVHTGMRKGVLNTKKLEDLREKVKTHINANEINLSDIPDDFTAESMFTSGTVDDEPKEELPVMRVMVEQTKPKAVKPIGNYERRTVEIFSAMPTEDTWEVFSVNEYNCQVIYGEPVELPMPVIKMIEGLTTNIHRKNKDGFAEPKEVKKYVVNYV